MASSGMLHRVALVRIDVSEELSASIIRVTRIISSQHASVAPYDYVPNSPILVTLMVEALSSSKTSVLRRATRRDIPEEAILHLCNRPLRPIRFSYVADSTLCRQSAHRWRL
jgi:hypothetical protein